MTDDQKREAQQQRDRIARLQHADDMKALLATQAGRRLMWGWLSHCGPFRTPWAGADHASTDFRCGVHSVGLMLLAEVMQHVPQALQQMQVEHDGYLAAQAAATVPPHDDPDRDHDEFA